MNFPFKSGPHAKGRSKNNEMMAVVTKALVFVAIWSIINRFILFGGTVAIHGILIILVACTVAFATHVLFYMFFDALEKKKFSSFKERVTSVIPQTRQGVPFVTALILAMALNPATPLYVVGAAIFFAEVFIKLLFGGFGQNIFNPVAAALVFVGVTFGATSLTVAYLPDTIATATPLAGLNNAGWSMTQGQAITFIENSGGLGRMFLGIQTGALGETARFAAVLALIYMIYKRAVDWVIPVFFLGTVAIITSIIGMVIGVGFWYPLLHLLSGGLVFGAIFMATDPVTSPINRQGKVIYAILLAMFTLLIRLNSNHLEGVAFALLLLNMFVPFIDSKTANVTTADTNKKVMTTAGTFAVALVVVIGFTALVGGVYGLF